MYVVLCRGMLGVKGAASFKLPNVARFRGSLAMNTRRLCAYGVCVCVHTPIQYYKCGVPSFRNAKR